MLLAITYLPWPLPIIYRIESFQSIEGSVYVGKPFWTRTALG
jgi:hypothetical protein